MSQLLTSITTFLHTIELLPILFKVLGFGLFLILIMAALSPFESLGWWAGWFGASSPGPDARALEGGVGSEQVLPAADHYLVYLSGIGAIAGDYLFDAEVALLDELEAAIPGTLVLRDVFPYAMNNNGLTGQRFFASVWRWVKKSMLNGRVAFVALVVLRNLFQVAVSADRRFGPIYNYGTAQVILDSLLRHGYRVGGGKPVTLLGYSGGGQIAIGAATYLKAMIKGPLRIISLGGVIADDPGLDYIDHLYHLYGSKDPIQKVGAIAYAGRWPMLPYSPWNRAKAEGKISMIAIGPFKHNDPHGYFDAESKLDDGLSYQKRVVETIQAVIEQREHSLGDQPGRLPGAQA